MSTSLKPQSDPGDWLEHKSMLQRVDACRVMLTVHGFITAEENRKVKLRMRKWLLLNEMLDEARRYTGL